jgi:serine/threonine protein kinase
MPDPRVRIEETAATTPHPGADEATGDGARSGAGSQSGDVPARIGRFVIRRMLGEGAFGRVYHGFDSELHRDVAIKVPHQARLTPQFRERFLREARAVAAVHHPNVCPIFDVVSDVDPPYIVMHYVNGPTLHGWLAGSPLPPRDALKITGRLALGMAAAHAKGVIHRDLKPQNVLVEEDTKQVLITDFGLARIGDEAEMTAEGQAMGTPAYMAPEQASGKQAEVGPLSDVYSLGVILYRMLTGELPFQGVGLAVLWQAQFEEPKPPSAVRPGLDAGADALCLKAMAKKPADRYQSAREFATAISDYLRTIEKTGSSAHPAIPDSQKATKPAQPARPAGAKPAAPAPPKPAGPAPEPTPLGGPPPQVFELVEEQDPAFPRPPTPPAIPAPPPRRAAPVPPVGAGAPPAPPPANPVAPRSTPAPGTAVVVCPQCRSRLQVLPDRTAPVDCPKCACRFTVATGLEAARTMALRTPVPEAAPPRPTSRRRGANVEDEGAAPDREAWQSVARGLRLSALGLLLIAASLVGAVVAGIAAGHQPDPLPAAGVGVGMGFGLIMVAVGRRRAARLPAGVVGGRLAGTSAAAAWWAVACLVPPLLLVAASPPEPGSAVGLGGVLMTYASVSAGIGLLALLVGEFAFNRYLTAVGRHLGPGFPQALVQRARVVLQFIAGFALAAVIGARITAGVEGGSLRTALSAVTGVTACVALVLLWVWLLMSVWLQFGAGAEVRRYSRGEAGGN